jgi:hypothetical protein
MYRFAGMEVTDFLKGEERTIRFKPVFLKTGLKRMANLQETLSVIVRRNRTPVPFSF